MFDDRDAVVAALSAAPSATFERQAIPLEIPVTVFSGFYGFGPRAGRLPLPSLRLTGPPLFANFVRLQGPDPHVVSKMAARFDSAETASVAVATLGQQARKILVAEDAPDLGDLDPIALGDEFAWGWEMTVETKESQHRTDIGWRHGYWMVNLLSWSRADMSNVAAIEMAIALDSRLRDP